MRLSIGIGDADGNVDGEVLLAGSAEIDRVRPTHGMKLFPMAVRADEDKVSAIQDGAARVLLFRQKLVPYETGAGGGRLEGLEAASGFEPLNKGFADLCLNHLATPPLLRKLRPPASPLGSFQRPPSGSEGALHGAGNGIRTRDFNLGKVALYH